jgi:glycosyltransferase involved in cell wall biosynthesis
VTRPRTFSFVIPAHNEERVLGSTVGAVVDRLAGCPGSEVIIVENGSTDGTPRLASSLAQDLRSPAVAVRAAQSPKGLGHALREGIRLARADRVVLTAADLPFRFSDLDAAMALEDRPTVIIGSKAHPASVVETGPGRRVLSYGFRVLRRQLLGLDVGDSQGSIIIDRDVAQALLPALSADGYFIATELVARAHRQGLHPVEVPVVYRHPRADSKVHPVRDSWAALRALVRLRVQLDREAALHRAVPVRSAPAR